MIKQDGMRVFVWFLVFCLSIELIFISTSPSSKFEEPVRNETQKRFWPEYLSGSDKPSDKDLLVYISNSQAVGTEIQDESLVYTYVLRSELKQSHPELHFENWSVSGLTAEQLELLVLQAESRSAKFIVLAVSILNFDSLRNYRFSNDSTDINLLVGTPALWFGLKNTFIDAYINWDDKVERLLKLTSETLRAKTRVYDLLAERIERRWHVPLFGHARNRDARKTIKQLAPESGPVQNVEVTKLTNPMTPLMWERSIQISNVPRLNAVYSKLNDRLKKSKTQLLWLWIPVGRNGDNLAAVEGQKQLVDEHCMLVKKDGWFCKDLSEALAPSLFIPSTFASHLTLEGHQAQARLITSILQDAIH